MRQSYGRGVPDRGYRTGGTGQGVPDEGVPDEGVPDEGNVSEEGVYKVILVIQENARCCCRTQQTVSNPVLLGGGKPKSKIVRVPSFRSAVIGTAFRAVLSSATATVRRATRASLCC